MRIESSLLLNHGLRQLGVRSVFGERSADLTGISDAKPLFLDQVLHVVAVDVNEEGTEAAAATGAVAVGGPGLPVVCADRPFLFAIRHRPSGLLLFVGRVVDPRGDRVAPEDDEMEP